MRILITGADQPLGQVVARALRAEHEVLLTGAASRAPEGLAGLPYVAADLRQSDQAAALLAGVEAIAHLAPHARPDTTGPAAEGRALDDAARSMFVLQHAALAAGVRRIVLASHLDLMTAYPENMAVDQNWQPQPEATAASLAPFLAELTLREFARAEDLIGICLRLGDLGGGPAGTSPEDAAEAVRKALAMDLAGRKYRWWVFHICSTDRYALGAAAEPPFNFTRLSRNMESVDAAGS